jgi:hypothetical protein
LVSGNQQGVLLQEQAQYKGQGIHGNNQTAISRAVVVSLPLLKQMSGLLQCMKQSRLPLSSLGSLSLHQVTLFTYQLMRQHQPAVQLGQHMCPRMP